jgi:hypothetical protein
MKNKFLIFILFYAYISHSLDYNNRPDNLQNKINESFELINNFTKSSWGLYNGKKSYYIAYINEYRLIKAMMAKYPEQNEFHVLDIGAGDFQLAQNLCKRINNDNEILENKKIYIFSLRGEQNLNEKDPPDRKCQSYEFGSFKIEELSKELALKNINLDNQTDLIFSRWALRH